MSYFPLKDQAKFSKVLKEIEQRLTHPFYGIILETERKKQGCNIIEVHYWVFQHEAIGLLSLGKKL